MQKRLVPAYHLGTILTPDLRWYNQIDEQALELIDEIDVSGDSSFLFIGHSQGGLVSRSAIQQLVASGRSHLVEGVITVGTPHEGALLALTGTDGLRDFVHWFLNEVKYVCRRNVMVCWQADLVTLLTSYLVDYMVIPEALEPEHPFLARLNAHPEEFPRFGIESYADERWMPGRLVGDIFTGEDDPYPRGRDVVAAMDYTAFALFTSGIIAYLYYDNLLIASQFWQALTYMIWFNYAWDSLTSPNLPSDGIVQYPSQRYPNPTILLEPIWGGDSHTGETKSPHVLERLDVLLPRYFDVESR